MFISPGKTLPTIDANKPRKLFMDELAPSAAREGGGLGAVPSPPLFGQVLLY